MTKDEFIAQRRTAKRIDNHFGLALYAIFFVAVLGCVVTDRLRSRSLLDDQLLLYGFGLFMLFCVVSITMTVAFSGRSHRKQIYPCPSCGKPVVGIVALIAVASDRCGHCGAAVFDTPEA